MNKFIDSHAHILREYYPRDKNEVIKNSENTIIIINGVDLESNKEILKTIIKNDNTYGALGIHPTEVNDYELSDLESVFESLDNDKIIAVGETGLDLYWNKDNFEKQKEFFVKHIEKAIEHNLPVIIHSRNAEEEVYEIIKGYKDLKSILHCYGGNLETAQKFVKLGSLIGIGGVVTFKKSYQLQEIVKKININNLITETDSPYLSPEPYRGKRNEPKNVEYIVEKIAEIKGEKPNKIKELIYNNFVREFDLK